MAALCDDEGYILQSGTIGDLAVSHPVVPLHIKDASLALHVACLEPVGILLE
jgi:hypothetical protein